MYHDNLIHRPPPLIPKHHRRIHELAEQAFIGRNGLAPALRNGEPEYMTLSPAPWDIRPAHPHSQYEHTPAARFPRQFGDRPDYGPASSLNGSFPRFKGAHLADDTPDWMSRTVSREQNWPRPRTHRPVPDHDGNVCELSRASSALQMVNWNLQNIIADGHFIGMKSDPWEEVEEEGIPMNHFADIPEIPCRNRGDGVLPSVHVPQLPAPSEAVVCEEEINASGKSTVENHPDTDQRKATLSHENSSSGRICESIAELPSDSIADPAVADSTVFDTQSLYSFPAVPNLVDCTLEGDFRRRVNSVPASHFSPGKIRPRRGSDASHFHGEDRGDPIVLKVLPEDFLDNGKLNLIPGDFEAPTTADGFRSRLNSFLRRNPLASSHEFPVFLVHDSFACAKAIDEGNAEGAGEGNVVVRILKHNLQS